MPKRTDIQSIMIIGAGPIVIGQACEFDYSGAQACKALKAEGYRVDFGELQSGDDHDRSGPRRRHLRRADHARDRRKDHRPREAGRAAPHHGRPDRAEHRDETGRQRRVGPARGRTDRRQSRRHRPRRGPAEIPRRHGRDRHRSRRVPPSPIRWRKPASRSPTPACPPSSGPRFTLGRHRRRHCLQQGGVRADRQRRSRSLADHRGADRRIHRRLERVRDGGRARSQRQLHHRLLDRERGSDGHPHRQLGHRGAGFDADGQRISTHAGRLDRLFAQDRRRYRRIERAIRAQPGRRADGHHRDEPAGFPLLRLGVEGNRVPDRQDRRQARGRLHAGRTGQRHHHGHAGQLRADDRLRRGQNPSLHLREIPRHAGAADHVDEVGWRGDGDRPLLRRGAAKGAAQHGDRIVRTRPDGASGRRRSRLVPRGIVARRGPIGCWSRRRRSGPACRSRTSTTAASSTRGSCANWNASSRPSAP